MAEEAAFNVCSTFSNPKPTFGNYERRQKCQVLRRCKSDKPYVGRDNSGLCVKKQATRVRLKQAEKENMDPEAELPLTRSDVLRCDSSEHRRPLENSDVNSHSLDNQSFENEDSCDSGEDDFIFDTNNNQGICTSNTKRLSEAEGGATTPPPSPTWNLRILCNAVSPEIRRMQLQRENAGDEERSSSASVASSSTTATNHPMVSPSEENSCDYTEFISSQDSALGLEFEVITSRKDKSLGRLCDKFLLRYPDHPGNDRINICLDEVAKDLGVERRRIYDIVNVLESVEIVSRAAKNKYSWHGKTNLPHTLLKLKILAVKENMFEQIMRIKEQEMAKDLNESGVDIETSVWDLRPENDSKLEDIFQRKERSLGIMSQKFLMLFLVSKPKTVNLELSAKMLIGDDALEASKFKTKIRRLYDIANILTSLRLIKKIHVTEIRGRKPAFQYTGPDVDNVHDVDSCCNDGCHRPSSRHSLLDCVRNENVQSIMHGFRPIRPAGSVLPDFKVKLSFDGLDEAASGNYLPRNNSLDEICKVTEQERNLLIGSASEPTSPIRKHLSDDVNPAPGTKVTRFAIPLSMSKHLSFDDHMVKCGTSTAPRLIHRPHARSLQPQVKNVVLHTPTPGTKPAETIILSHSGEIKSVNSVGTAQHIPLSKSQFETILHSLNFAKSSAQRQIHFNKPSDGPAPFTILGRSLLQSPDYDVSALKASSPGSVLQNRSLKRNLVEIAVPSEKRIKLDLPNSSASTELIDSAVAWNEGSPSAPEIKIGLRRLNSMPVVTSTSQAGSLRILPQIIVRCVNKSAAATPPTDHFRLHVKNDQGATSWNDKTLLATRKHVVENITPTPGSFLSQLRTPTSNGFPVKIIANPMTPDPSPTSQTSLLSIAESFTPPTTPKNHLLFSTPLTGSRDSMQTDMHIIHQPGSLRKVLTATSTTLPPSHNLSSPFQVVVPSSSSKQSSTTFLLKMPPGKLTKTATM
ncbi:unnamed protein product [Candidula unifasciata]|uniref:E2F/DP family winged-helix DNA-binding domain-containing protein n=1 Tax=Candidula unifasciata TaxID=100452 RepID=A0A8S3ZC06_9EUPU|nr:unnamed protein product [Candidula unifasciata]